MNVVVHVLEIIGLSIVALSLVAVVAILIFGAIVNATWGKGK